MCTEDKQHHQQQQQQHQAASTTSEESTNRNDYELGRACDNHTIVGTLRPKRPVTATETTTTTTTTHDSNSTTSTTSTSNNSKNNNTTLKIGVEGNWYDLTSFAKYHPGGDIIWEFNNKDATVQFLAFHDPKILARVESKKIRGATYEFSRDKPGGSALEGDWIKLTDKFEKLGYYEPNLPYLYGRWAIVAGFFTWIFVHMYLYVSCGVTISLPLASMGMALVWQQNGFLLHDAMHSHHFHNRKLDQAFGYIYGILFGVSSKWWRDEHFEHHVFTNTYVEGVGCSDPQFWEDVWVQDPALIPFAFQPLVKFILRYQQYYFLPICVFVGSIGIRIDSFVSTKRPLEKLCMFLHWAWVGMAAAMFPSWKEGLVFYYIACCFSGFLSIQLLVSHYSKPFAKKHSVKESGSWAYRQIEAILDIMCPAWLDWFFGGLHLHSPHHLFPRLNRCHYREVYPMIEEMCRKNNVTLDKLNFIPAVQQTLQHLGDIADLADLDESEIANREQMQKKKQL